MADQRLPVLFTMLVGLAAFSNGQFEIYADIRIESESAAVAVGVSTEYGCKNYLVTMQETHEAVSYDSQSGRCCSILKNVNYTTQYANGWSTYKIANVLSTAYPSTTGQTWNATQSYTSSRNYNTSQGFNATQGYSSTQNQGYSSTQSQGYSTTLKYNSTKVYGICDGFQDVHLNPEEEITLSVYSYDFDMCSGFPQSAYYYPINITCAYQVHSHQVEGFEYSLSYDLHYGDNLILFDENQWYNYAGLESQVQNALFGDIVYIEFNSDNAWVAKGFCLKIKAKTRLEAVTEPPHPITTSNPSETELTYGVCDGPSYRTISETGLFTFESYSPSACSSFPGSSYYYLDSSDCSVLVDSYYDTIGYEYSISYETEECCDYIGLSNNSAGVNEIQFRGSSSVAGYIVGPLARISFYSDFSSEERGFCLQLTPVRQSSQTTLPVKNTTQVTDTRTVGVCGDYIDSLLQFGQVVTFSVSSYNFDLCPTFPYQADYYQNNRYCSQLVQNPEADGFDFTVQFDLANGDKLEIASNEARFSFSSRNDSVSRYIRGQFVSITFQSDSKDVGKGFCLKITPVRASVTATVPAVVSTTTRPVSLKTIGVCDYHTQFYNSALNRPVSVSSDSRDYDCADQELSAYYNADSFCSLRFVHPSNSTGRWVLQLLTLSDAPYSSLSANALSEFTNTINLVDTKSYFTSARTLEIVWSTSPYLDSGFYSAFCLKVTAYYL